METNGTEHTTRAIGVIGGMGPYAGLDLVRKIFDNTVAGTDQDHLPVALLSYPHLIIDRSTYIFGQTKENPALALADIARKLEAAGAVVAAMPCNTAHAPMIFDVIGEELYRTGHKIRMLSMIDEAARFVRDEMDGVQRVGVISTMATYKLGLYTKALEAAGIEPVLPDEDVEEHLVNRTIFDPNFGIKAKANPVTHTARQNLLDAIGHLQQKGAETVILGCTELPLAITESQIGSVTMIDPTVVIARALIRETYPHKLLPLQMHVPAGEI
ncbi:MAG TPA: amino acid racemase [Rhodothermales bacterium]|nr:amino acid racemase [Rhodothermales bacterium]